MACTGISLYWNNRYCCIDHRAVLWGSFINEINSENTCSLVQDFMCHIHVFFLQCWFCVDERTFIAMIRCACFSLKMIEDEVIQQCQDKLGLIHLEKDLNISPAQMTQCCERLMDNADEITTYMEGVRVRVTQYYSVTDDGLVCIPWNWENDWVKFIHNIWFYFYEGILGVLINYVNDLLNLALLHQLWYFFYNIRF